MGSEEKARLGGPGEARGGVRPEVGVRPDVLGGREEARRGGREAGRQRGREAPTNPKVGRSKQAKGKQSKQSKQSKQKSKQAQL